MNWGVAFRLCRREFSSTILPTANHRADFRRYSSAVSVTRLRIVVMMDYSYITGIFFL